MTSDKRGEKKSKGIKKFCNKCGFAKLAVVRPEDEGVCRCSPLQEPREKTDYQKRIEEILEPKKKIGTLDVYDLEKAVDQLLSLLQEVRSEAYKDGRQSINQRLYKYQHAYNRTPNRAEASRHRFHKKQNKVFKNCNLCKK